MIRSMLVLGLAFELIGCAGRNKDPAIAPSGAASAPAAPQGRQRPASESVSSEQIQALIAKLEKGEAKANDLQGLSAAAANAAVPGVIAALKNQDPSVRREAIKVLRHFMVDGSPERKGALSALSSAERALIAALKDDDADVRKEAIDALRTAPGTKDRASLYIDPLKDSDHFVRMRAASALGQIGPAAKDAVPGLATAMADPNEIVGDTAAHALVQIGLPAVPALVKELRHDNTDVRRRAAYSLAEIGPAAEEAIPELKEASKARDQVVAALSLWALTMIDRKNHPPQETVRALMEMMKSSGEVQVLGRAAYALGRIGPDGRSAIPLLIEAIKHRHFMVHEPAFFALGQLGADAKDAVPALIHAMRDNYPGNWIHNHRAVETLGSIGPAARAAVPDLIQALKESKDLAMRALAAEALGKIGPAETVVPVLVETVKDENEWVRRKAVSGLRALGPAAKPAMPALFEAFRSPDRPVDYWYVADAFAAIGAAAIPALIQALRDGEQSGGAMAADALGKMGPKAKEAVPALMEALKDGAYSPRAAKAAWALGEMGKEAKAAVPALIEAAEGPKDAARPAEAGRALKKIDPAAAAKLGLQ